MRDPVSGKSRPKVLVLLAARNGSEWIEEQIKTILEQLDVDIELVISDDRSTDSTKESVAIFLADDRVRLITPAASTGSAAQNFLGMIRNTPFGKQDYIALADQDDLWEPAKISRACETLRRSGSAGYSCAVTAFWRDGREALLSQVVSITESDFLFEGAGQGCTFVLTVPFATRIANYFIEHVSRTETLHYHDWAIYALARSWDLIWIFDPRPMMRYRQHANNDTGARVSVAAVKKRLRLIKNGWYLDQLKKIAEICALAAPSDPKIAEWKNLVSGKKTLAGQARKLVFCLRGGRRRKSDTLILVVAVICAWI